MSRSSSLITYHYSLLTVLLLALCYFALSPTAQAVLPAPPPDGGYPGNNTAEGQNALQSLTSGLNNAGIGFRALFKDTSGGNNTATGAQTLFNNTTASHNTATGYISLYNNTTGSFNVGDGDRALYSNTSGIQNTATGYQALGLNATGGENTATGYQALLHNTDGSGNNAVGAFALSVNVSGLLNTAIGDRALQNSTGNYNTALGAEAGTDPGIGNNNIYVGDPGFPGDNNVIAIGGIAASGTPYDKCFIGGIYGASVNTGTALPVYVDTDGHLGTVLVNANGKPAAKRMPHGNGAKPQAMIDRNVEQQQATITELKSTVAQQQKQIETLTAQLKEQAAQIQKVSAQVELSKPARTIVNNQ